MATEWPDQLTSSSQYTLQYIYIYVQVVNYGHLVARPADQLITVLNSTIYIYSVRGELYQMKNVVFDKQRRYEILQQFTVCSLDCVNISKVSSINSFL